ncbi:MAG TPA: hypothetical protein VGN51_21580 [Acidimicrobiia bacterium]|jgi:hypothetical protein
MRAGLVLPPPTRERVDDHFLDALGPFWTRVDHVPFGATVDIEHVLLACTGISVVTTMGADAELAEAVTEARWRARKVTALLGRVAWVAALPVLVVSELAELAIVGSYTMHDGVLLVRAVDPASWIAHLEAQPSMLDDATIGEMVDVIIDHTQRTDAIVSTYTQS